MRLPIGAGTPKEAMARGCGFIFLVPTDNPAADKAIVLFVVTTSAGPAFIVFHIGVDYPHG